MITLTEHQRKLAKDLNESTIEGQREVLQHNADPKCKKCFGLGTLGWNQTFNKYSLCECVKDDKNKT